MQLIFKNIADLQMTGDQLPNILGFYTTYMYDVCTLYIHTTASLQNVCM